MVMSQRMKQLCFQLRLKSTQLFIIAGSVVLSLLITLLCIGFMVRYEVNNEVANMGDVDFWKDKVSPEQQLWYDKGIQELKHALRMPAALNQPKNVIILLINGIDGRALAAARFSGNNSSSNSSSEGHASFIWDQFPHLARLKNSCSYTSPCDAASVAKAFWSGVPLAAVLRMDTNCSSSNRSFNETESGHLRSVLRQAQLAGMRTGFVTNQRITGPTGAALYAHVAKTSWECDGLMPMGAIELGCKDVARQLISGETGRELNVVMGGGRQLLSAKVPRFAYDPVDELLCRARTGRNLLRDWQREKLKLKPSRRFELVQQANELRFLNGTKLDYLLGVLANGDLIGNTQAPTLQLMLNKTLEVLRRPDVGHLLIVEHFVKQQQMDATRQLLLLNETLASLLGQKDVLTLVLITNGNYLSSSRDVSDETELVTTLQEAFEQPELQLQHRLQQMFSETLLFAQGPKSFLFHGVHDETYLAHALSYALGLGVFSKQL